MARLSAAILGLALSWATPAAADPVDRWAAYIGEASSRFGLPEVWIRRVMDAESGGRILLNGRPIVSPAGAIGLMQLMPGTWREMRALLELGDDPQEPHDNILAGTAYLRAMYDRFGYPGLFAAYNAGPARYARHLASGRRLPAETIAYVRAVTEAEAPSSPAPPAPPALFVARIDERAAIAAPAPAPPASASLFVALGGGAR